MNRKYTILSIVIVLFFGGFMVLQGAVPKSVEVFGSVFMMVRIAIYACLFFLWFETITVPALNRFTRNPNYADENIRPYRYRILFWIAIVELLLFTS